MKQRSWSFALYVLFLPLATIIAYAQNNDSLSLIMLSFDSVYIFDTQTQEITIQEYSEQFSEIFHPLSDVVSPSGYYRLTWESDLSSGLFLTNNTTPDNTLNFNVNISDSIDEVRINWLFNDRLAIISAGTISDSLALTPDLEPNQMWILDTSTLQLSDWYWNCNTVIHVKSSNRLAMLCELLDFPNAAGQSQSVILNSDGSVIQQPTDYSVVFVADFYPLLAFSQDTTSIAFVDNNDVINRKVKLYNVMSQESLLLAIYESIESIPIKLRFSPLGQQLAVFKTCQVKSTCLDIYSTSSADSIFTSSQLTYSNDENFTARSIYWTDNEEMIFLLAEDNQTSVLWSLEANNMEITSTWEIPTGSEYIIDIWSNE
jgi:hypothetical protein